MPSPPFDLAAALAVKSIVALPNPVELGLSAVLAGELAAHAAAATGNEVSARALAALPAVGGGTPASRLPLFGARLFGGTDPAGGPPQPTLAEAAAAAASHATAQAKAQGAAIEATVRAQLADTPTDTVQQSEQAPAPATHVAGDRWSGLRHEPTGPVPGPRASARHWRSIHPAATEPATTP
jgi:hypothetical protein